MSVYPFELDDDTTLPRVDDNITETGQEAINALRDAVFNVQETLGVEPNGSVSTVANRLDASLNADGTIKASALASIGLVTLPITNNQVGSNAGIEESKLSLVHSTTDLYTLIVAADVLINSVKSLAEETSSDFALHLSGAELLSDGSTSAKHVLSHIDLNSVPSDSRDVFFTWTGLKDKNGSQRSATNAAEALLQINDDFTSHQNTSLEAHIASAIIVDTDNFKEIPLSATNAQSVFNYLDQSEILNMGQHRATQHANGIPKISRSTVIGLDGYGHNVVPSTSCYTYLTEPPNTFPVDDLFFGDDIIKFVPDNSSFKFDALFSQVRVGDLIRVNYANGLEAIYPITSIRYTPGSEWLVRINGTNLCSSTDGYASARIDKSLYDVDTAGIFATAHANARNLSGPTATNNLSSVIVADPRGAMALGLNFDPNQLNSTHYNLYLELYPNGNPADKVVSLPPIDVTGNAGATPGLYTLSSVVATTNDKFREFGYNYRFIAFEHNGEFGVMLADVINSASFAIINGTNSSGTLVTGSYTNNVIGGNNIVSDIFDPLGFGTLGSNLASPAYQGTWADSTAAQIPTKVIRPLNRRYAIVNGQKLDKFQDMYLATDGYWDGYVSSRVQLGLSTVETTYTVSASLAASGIKAGKTLVVQPAIGFDSPLYNDVDYGRFIIKSVNFIGACGTSPAYTQITVLNSIAGSFLPAVPSAEPDLPVKLYFSYDSVGFNFDNIIDTLSGSTDYKRFHDIYLTDSGKTFSHERLRMPIQAEAGSLLGTNNFHIIDVSSKLRGYTDGSLTILNKYLRFYVLNYDSVTGEFDGYLGQRVPSTVNVEKTGKIVTGKKNVVTRFYDETNIDYVDLLFSDSSSSPGVAVLSSALPRYVDLEIFPSLRTNDELFLLSSCEVNWDPLSGENIVQYLNNRREFGSIDETDFTESAKDYIAAANKYLHDNGVIRGLDYEATLTGGEIRFKGGAAVIGGKVISANNQGVVIPQVYPQSTSLPQSLDWAICLNEFGNLVPVILTSTKQVFFATNGVQNYQLSSVTFNEIVNERKDLCLIAIASVTIASITINNVTDARKFVSGLDSAAPFVWSSGDDYLGNFYSFDAVRNYLINSNGKNNKILIRGVFNITSSIDLTGFTGPVTIDGSEAQITFSPHGLGKGILLGSNLTLENWNINYIPSGISYTPNYVRNGGAGCFYFQGGNVSNVTIKNCLFTSFTLQHPPFINFEYTFGNILENIIIENNKFNASGPTSLLLNNLQAAISFCNNGTSGTESAWLKHVIIKDNYSEDHHGIYVTSTDAGSAPPGTHVNCIIENNTCGTIGYWVGTDGTSNYGTNQNLIIKNNFAKLICTFVDYSIILGTVLSTCSNVIIQDNSANWIQCQISETNTLKSSLAIKNNKLTGWNSTYLSYFSTSPINNNAIMAVNNSGISYMTPILIEENMITYGVNSSTSYGYDVSMLVSGSSNINNNIISGIATAGTGLLLFRYSISTNNHIYNITDNIFLRNNNIIEYYINVIITGSSSLASNASGIIQNNIFDSNSNGTNENVTNFSFGSNPSNWVYDSNTNNTSEVYLNNNLFNSFIGKKLGLYYQYIKNNFNSFSTLNSYIGYDLYVGASAPDIILYYDNSPDEIQFILAFDLLGAINNVKIKSIDLEYRIFTNPATTGSIKVSLLDSRGTETSFTPINLLTASTGVIATSTFNLGASEGFISRGSYVPNLKIETTIDHSSSMNVEIKSILIKYTSL